MYSLHPPPPRLAAPAPLLFPFVFQLCRSALVFDQAPSDQPFCLCRLLSHTLPLKSACPRTRQHRLTDRALLYNDQSIQVKH